MCIMTHTLVWHDTFVCATCHVTTRERGKKKFLVGLLVSFFSFFFFLFCLSRVMTCHVHTTHVTRGNESLVMT